MRSRWYPVSLESASEIASTYLFFSRSCLLCIPFSHSMRSTAMSQVSRITSGSCTSSRNCRSNSKLPLSDNAPRASAASWRHMESSALSSSTCRRGAMAASFPDCPRQYASSCLSKADGDVNAAAIASMAGTDCSVGGCWDARYLSEKRARKRRARASSSDVRILRSVWTWSPCSAVLGPAIIVNSSM